MKKKFAAKVKTYLKLQYINVHVHVNKYQKKLGGGAVVLLGSKYEYTIKIIVSLR